MDTTGIDGRCFVAQEEKDPIQLVPIFGLPLRLADWAYMENWSWQSPHLTEIFKRAVEGGLAWSSTLTWVGHPEVFSRPAVSFFTLLRLEEDLEEHGYHMFALPILALHCQLANAFQSPVKEAVACTAKLRLLRMAGECRLRQAVGQLREEVTKELNDIPETFDSFKEAGEFGQYTVQLRKWWLEFYNCLEMLRPFRPRWKMRMCSLLLSIRCISFDHNLSFESGKSWESCFKNLQNVLSQLIVFVFLLHLIQGTLGNFWGIQGNSLTKDSIQMFNSMDLQNSCSPLLTTGTGAGA